MVVDQLAIIGALAARRRLRSWGITMTTCALTSSVGPSTSVGVTKANGLGQAVLALTYRRLTHHIGVPSAAVQG